MVRPGGKSATAAATRTLGELLERVADASPSRVEPDPAIGRVRFNSADVRPGDLFVALGGSATDGHRYIPDAVRRGAAAVVAERDWAASAPVPVIRVPDTRRALAELASAWYGEPHADLRLVGITGTVGKTSVLALLEAILLRAGQHLGTIGSLGVHADGSTLRETGYTAPDPLLLHESLARLRDGGIDLVGMEVTSHALHQRRVHGITFCLGILTNLLPLEHQEYHDSFEGYLGAKVRFFDHLEPLAPLIYDRDDPTVRAIVREFPVRGVPCGRGEGACSRIHSQQVHAAGTRLTLSVTEPLPALSGEPIAPADLPLELRLLGRSNVTNAALAATAALMLGAPPAAIRLALADFPPPRRRAEVIHSGEFTVIDDTIGHPESVNSLFEAVQALEPDRIRIAFAVRGCRGADINRQIAQSLAIWTSRLPLASLVVTRSAEAADERNRVTDEELAAFTDPLATAGLPFRVTERLDAAVGRVLNDVRPGDLVLLLGAQGMDAGARLARSWFSRAGHDPS